ncbi:hypothetical protein [Psychrobacter sp. 16-MNA-CIBAN-0192]|uniref:hypothetical protein n=1 Tax=Psychrobacter sp. 16-MNA-CIBAN-0192 TaxID=3140448 RepID=UPI00331E9101
MTTKIRRPVAAKPSFLLPTLPIVIISMIAVATLIGCQPPPVEPSAPAIQDMKTPPHTEVPVIIESMSAPNYIEPASIAAINIANQQTIAQQPHCDAVQSHCQYFELNVLIFTPEQPWLTTIMWQTIARVIAPETPLASQGEAAKKTVLKLFKQVEYAEQVVDTLPLYQRIDSTLVLNSAHNSSVATGYLRIRATQQRDSQLTDSVRQNSKNQEQLSYVMLDMQKKLRLTISDILLPNITTAQLMQVFKPAKQSWVKAKGNQPNNQYLAGAEQNYMTDWEIPLARQWYLDNKGLHMVYQSGELLAMQTEVVDMVVPYSALYGLIQPHYIVAD